MVNKTQKKQKKKNSDSPRITLVQEGQQYTPEGMICGECQNHSLYNEGGCLTCKECGWSKCD